MSPSFKFRGFLGKLGLLCSTLRGAPPVLREETRSAVAHVQEPLGTAVIRQSAGVESRALRGADSRRHLSSGGKMKRQRILVVLAALVLALAGVRGAAQQARRAADPLLEAARHIMG